jgi:hypothetical protein
MLKRLIKKHTLRKAKKIEKKLQKALKIEALSFEKKEATPYDREVLSWDTVDFIKHRKGSLFLKEAL